MPQFPIAKRSRIIKYDDCKICKGKGTTWSESYDGHRSDFYEQQCSSCLRRRNKELYDESQKKMYQELADALVIDAERLATVAKGLGYSVEYSRKRRID